MKSRERIKKQTWINRIGKVEQSLMLANSIQKYQGNLLTNPRNHIRKVLSTENKRCVKTGLEKQLSHEKLGDMAVQNFWAKHTAVQNCMNFLPQVHDRVKVHSQPCNFLASISDLYNHAYMHS